MQSFILMQNIKQRIELRGGGARGVRFVPQMAYVTNICKPKRQIPYMACIEKFTVVHWHMLCKPFLCTPTKSLITWHMLLLGSIQYWPERALFCFHHIFACFYFFVNINGWTTIFRD